MLDWLRPDPEEPDDSLISSGLPFRALGRVQAGISGQSRTWPLSFRAAFEARAQRRLSP